MAVLKYKDGDGNYQDIVGINVVQNEVVQTTGNSTTAVMSQKAVTDELANEKQGNGIGTCSTSSGTALTVSLTGYELVQNGFVAVSFTNDVPASATLNINGKGAKPIIYKGSAIEADVIKADDTVTFGYDGTNYVVTSLGGGGGSSTYPEFVTIQLTQTGGSDSDLIGATVVVTNDDTSATILSTMWQGEGIAVQVNAGLDYTVTIGTVTDYTIQQNTQSYTAESGLARLITFTYKGFVVDLGLPSGLLWARGNIISASGSYKIGAETDYGAYVSWGNVTPHFSSNGSTFDNSYSWGTSNADVYASTPGSNISGAQTTSASYTPNSGYDAARQLLGGNWRTPTSAEFKELNDSCTSAWVTKNGVAGREFTSNINGAKLFIPAAGLGHSTNVAYFNSQGYYWSSSLYSNDNGYNLVFSEIAINAQQNTSKRFYGFSMRAVQ